MCKRVIAKHSARLDYRVKKSLTMGHLKGVHVECSDRLPLGTRDYDRAFCKHMILTQDLTPEVRAAVDRVLSLVVPT